jgi:DNA-directed RNA polymerase sigma subunit (sigma70/sigma32)
MLIAIVKKGLAALTSQEERVMRLRFGISEDETDSNNFPITKSQLTALRTRKR